MIGSPWPGGTQTVSAEALAPLAVMSTKAIATHAPTTTLRSALNVLIASSCLDV
jgi:hypothetical protein